MILARKWTRKQQVKSGLDLHVIFTDPHGTRDSLAAAGKLARDLNASIRLLAAQVVPYPLSLDRPHIPIEFTERVLFDLSTGTQAETTIEIYLCRDRVQTIRALLDSGSLVVTGGGDKKLARALDRDGHRVVLV